jgi:hypothetical protein
LRKAKIKKRLRKKPLKSEKRIVSGIEKLETMRFIVGRFTSFSPEVEFWPSLFKLYVILNSE